MWFTLNHNRVGLYVLNPYPNHFIPQSNPTWDWPGAWVRTAYKYKHVTQWQNACNKGYSVTMAYVTRPHEWRFSVARGTKPYGKKYPELRYDTLVWVDSFRLLTTSVRVCKRVEILSRFSYVFLVLSFLICEIRYNSPDIDPFGFFSACNPDCSIRMNWRDCPWFTVITTFCFAEDTVFPYQYSITNFVIIIHTCLFSRAVLRSVWRCL